MRPALSLLLAALLASCPIVCGTAHALSGDDGHGRAPARGASLPAPANDDDCACNGAVKASDAWTSAGLSDIAQSLDSPFPPPLFEALALVPARSAEPEGLATPPPGDVRGGASRPYLRC